VPRFWNIEAIGESSKSYSRIFPFLQANREVRYTVAQPGETVRQRDLAVTQARLRPGAGRKRLMADLYRKTLEAERSGLWAECRLKGLARGTVQRERIEEIDKLLAEHKAKSAK
jgi:hypothetical protein